MEFESTINYNCDVITNQDGSLTLTGKEDQNTFSSNGVIITLEKGASVTIHSIARKPAPFTVWISDDDLHTKAIVQKMMSRMGEEVLVVSDNPYPDNPYPEIPYISDRINNLRLSTDNIREFFKDSVEQEDKPKKLNASTFQHRKGAFANGGRG